MNLIRLYATLTRDEGRELERYEIGGIPHIGVGCNLDTLELTDQELEWFGVEDEDEIQTITDEQADYLLGKHVNEFTEVCENVFSNWEELSAVRQEVLVNVALNVGGGGIRKFRKMISAVHSEDWEEAAVQMLDSRAARQTGERYQRLARAFAYDDGEHFEVEYDVEDHLVEDDAPHDPIRDHGLKIVNERIDTLESMLQEILGLLANKRAPRS